MFGTYRTLLALMVVALHIGGVPVIGVYAVFGFYVLSGYLMTLIMQRNYGYTWRGRYKYAINRFLRIYPIYWVSIALSALLIFLLGSEYTSSYHQAIYLPGNLTETLNNVFIFFPLREWPRLTPPAWALTVELFFYICIGLGLSRNRKIVLYWFCISVLYHVAIVVSGLEWKYRYFTIPAASLPFSTGALLFHYNNDIMSYVRKVNGAIYNYLPLIVFSGLLVNWISGYLLGISEGVSFYLNYIMCAFMVAVLSERESLPYVTRRMDKWLGDLSYPIYLVHYQVGLIVIVLMARWGIEFERPDIILMIISVPLILVVSWLIASSIEKPIEVLRSRVKKTM